MIYSIKLFHLDSLQQHKLSFFHLCLQNNTKNTKKQEENVVDNPVSNTNENNGDLIPLTISRESKVMGFAVSFNVFVDGVNLGALKNGKSLTCQVGQGVHEILIKCVEKDVKQTITVLRSNHSVEIITYAKIGLLAAVAEIKDIIYK